MQIRACKYRLYPTIEQENVLRQYVGAVRFVYNLALEQRRDWSRHYRNTTGRPLSFARQCNELTELRREIPWIADVPRMICEHALRDLDLAYAGFFTGRTGHPSMRRRGENDSFRAPGRDCNIVVVNRKWALLSIPKCTPLKLRLSRALNGEIRNVTVQLSGGAWYASCLVQDDTAQGESDLPSVGIDRGVINTFSLSTGEHYQMPDHVAASIDKRKRAQRILSRRKKGSARRARQKTVVAKHHAHTAAARSHWLHERSTDIARRFGVVTLEKLKVANMTASGTGKRGLNRSILAQGWTAFATMLEYKLEARGGRVEYINPAYTSQSCSECGSVNRESRKSQAVFHCVDCGHAAHADTNAAINILRRSPASVEGAGYGPVEAHIGTMLTHRENLAA